MICTADCDKFPAGAPRVFVGRNTLTQEAHHALFGGTIKRVELFLKLAFQPDCQQKIPSYRNTNTSGGFPGLGFKPRRRAI